MTNIVKWNREDGKKLEFHVEDFTKFYIDGKLIGSIEYLYNLKEGNDGILDVKKGMELVGKVKVTDQYIREAILQAAEDNKRTIESFFNNIEKLELERLSNGSIVTVEKFKDIEKLNNSYYNDRLENWIAENKKYFTEERVYTTEETTEMVYSTIYYNFKKESVAKVDKQIEEYKQTKEYKQKQIKDNEELEIRFELEELTRKLSDEDFEDFTGLLKEDYTS